ncbi:hypothetical protein [Deinococcus alpinitundrae]|uniref:hypothetical protein n=1 Tax=Deinococcus alpinitundrae TaxID=468913 RepID=UPI00137A10EB|nr:hypothetical protein [Deinococcus alpinitundrae]
MLKLYRLLPVSLLTLVLAACGQQTPAPAAVAAQRLLPCEQTLSLRPASDPCNQDPEPPNPPNPNRPESSATLAAGAVVLDDAVVSYDYDSGTLILNQTAVTASYVVGNTVIGGIVLPGAEAGVPPRHITSIGVDASGRYVMTTSEAALTDVVSDASLDYTRQLTAADINHVEYLDDSPASLSRQGLLKKLDVSTCTAPGLSILNLGYEKTFENNSKLSGCIDTAIGVNLHLRIRNWKVESFEASTKLSEQIKVKLEADATSGELKLAKKWDLAKYYMNPFYVPLGPIPLIVTPYITVSAGIDGSISGKVSYTAQQDASYRGGIAYENGSTKIINTPFGNTTLPNPLTSVSKDIKFTAKAYLQAKPGIGFFTTVGFGHADGGVYGIIRGYAKVDVDPLRRPLWQITAGPQFCGGFDVHMEILFGLFDNNWKKEQCGGEIRLYEAHSPDAGPTVPGSLNTWQKVELKFTLGQGQIEVYAFLDPNNPYNGTLVKRMDSAGTVDISPYISPTGTTFSVVGVSRRTSGIFGSYSHNLGMKVFADGVEIWHPNDADCSYCSSREEYNFLVENNTGVLSPNKSP